MTLVWLAPKILEITFNKSFDLCNSTYLFSHHYEDPVWMGKVFTRLELDEYYEQTTGDKDSWKKRWAGSNLPDVSFDKFMSGDFIGLTDFEMTLINELRTKPSPYYVIMTSREALYARDHEIAHAIFYTEPSYKEEALKIVNKYRSFLGEATQKLREAGYSDKVMDDELHVFCGIYYKEYLTHFKVQLPKDMISDLTTLFFKYKQDLGIA